jgi:hypothetical protein
MQTEGLKDHDVVKEYMVGEITADAAIQKARALPQTFQLSLHTTLALSFVDKVDVGLSNPKGLFT